MAGNRRRSGGTDEVRVEGWLVPIVSGVSTFAVVTVEIIDRDAPGNGVVSAERIAVTMSQGVLYQVAFETGDRQFRSAAEGLLMVDSARRRPRYRLLRWNAVSHSVGLTAWSPRMPR